MDKGYRDRFYVALQRSLYFRCQGVFNIVFRLSSSEVTSIIEEIKRMAKDAIELNGVVKECFPSSFKVVCDNGHEILAHLAGKMRKFYIKVLPGDRVVVEISPYDLQKGRIVRRIAEPKGRGPAGGAGDTGGTPS